MEVTETSVPLTLYYIPKPTNIKSSNIEDSKKTFWKCSKFFQNPVQIYYRIKSKGQWIKNWLMKQIIGEINHWWNIDEMYLGFVLTIEDYQNKFQYNNDDKYQIISNRNLILNHNLIKPKRNLQKL